MKLGAPSIAAFRGKNAMGGKAKKLQALFLIELAFRFFL
jgi:hypothetical protein